MVCVNLWNVFALVINYKKETTYPQCYNLLILMLQLGCRPVSRPLSKSILPPWIRRKIILM